MNGERRRWRSFSYGGVLVAFVYMIVFGVAFWDKEIGMIKVSEMGTLFLWVLGICIVIGIGLELIFLIFKEPEKK